MKKLKVVLLILVASACFNSCSKDDDKPSDDEAIDGGTIYTSELVRIAAEGLSQDLYDATFNGVSVQLVNNDQDELLFFVQSDLAKLDENNVLEVASLEMKINYTVVKTDLSTTPEETLAPLISNLNNIDTNGFAQGNKVQQFIDSFNNYYASLSAQEKTDMAEFYQANRELFNLIGEEGGRSTNFLGLSKCQQAKFLTATLGGAAGILANPATMGLSVLAGAGAVVAFMDAVEYCTAFMSQKLKQVFLKFDNMLSSRPGEDNSVYAIEQSGKNPHGQPNQMLSRKTTLTFEHGEPQSFDAANGMRSLQASDASDANSIIAEFFSLISSLNNFVLEKLNGAITYYNNQVSSFFQVDLFEIPIVVPTNGQVETRLFTQEIFNAFTFSVGSSEVELSSIGFSNGQVNLTLNMADPTQNEVSTTLDYVYHDEFNDRNGSFPIVVLTSCVSSDLAVTVTVDGSTATAQATGGKPPYLYFWSNGVTGQTVTGLSPGEYTVTAIDDNGCEITENVLIEPDEDPCENVPAPTIALIDAECDYNGLYLHTTFSYYDPSGLPIDDDHWTPVDGTASSTQYPELISGTSDNGIYKTVSGGIICWAYYNGHQTEVTIFVRNTCGKESNVLNINLD